jgi:hypothetical protein
MKLEILAGLVFLNMLATISLWQISARKPEKLKKKFLSALLHSDPSRQGISRPNASARDFANLSSAMTISFSLRILGTSRA